MTPAAILSLAIACAPNVAPSTLQSIVAQESNGYHLAIGLNDGRLTRQPSSIEEAVLWARWLRAHGRNFDAGLMQVNSQHWERFGLTAENIFDPCTNVRYGGLILTEAYVRAVKQYGVGSQALLAAISAYNTGSFKRGFSNGYVRKVLAKAGVHASAMPPIDDSDAPVRKRAGALDHAAALTQAVTNWQAQPEWGAAVSTFAPSTRDH